MDNSLKQVKNKKCRSKKVFWSFVVIFLLFVFYLGGYVIGKVGEGKIELKVNPELYAETELPTLFDSSLIQQIWTILKTDYVDKDKLNAKELYYGALKGFVEGVGDPHTNLLDPETAKEFEDQIDGDFEGIGAQIGLKDGLIVVVAPLPETPAAKAGLLAGDKIYAVDGQEVIGLSLEKVVRLIRGPNGTNVTLLIVRGDEDPREVTITRSVIEMKSVKWEVQSDGIAYIELNGFNSDTADLFKKAIKDIKNKQAKGIILDLRNNPGGLLSTAVDVCSYWIEKDLLLVEKFGDGNEVTYNAGDEAPFKGYPTVVLINEGSASGSEIVAGAFQDYQIATIVGKKSFGKGSVQALKKLPDGSSLKVTIAKWLTPKGRSINDEGIVPDVEVNLTTADVEKKLDPQLTRAMEILAEK